MTWSWELPSEIKLDSLQKIFLEWAGIDLGFPRMLARRSTTELSKLDTLKRNFSSNKLLSQLRGERGDDLLLQKFFQSVPCALNNIFPISYWPLTLLNCVSACFELRIWEKWWRSKCVCSMTGGRFELLAAAACLLLVVLQISPIH